MEENTAEGPSVIFKKGSRLTPSLFSDQISLQVHMFEITPIRKTRMEEFKKTIKRSMFVGL